MNPWEPGYFLEEAEGDGWEARMLPKASRGKWLRWREKQTFLFTLEKLTPVTFVQDNGDQIRPCLPGESFIFDFGSIPSIGQSLLRKEGVMYGYHDRAYDKGYLWIKAKDTHEWRATAIMRLEADALLYTMLRCSTDPRGRFKASLVYAAVAACGWACGYTYARCPLPEPVREYEAIVEVFE